MSEQALLLEIPEQPEPQALGSVSEMPAAPAPRYIPLDRQQTQWGTIDIEALIAPIHPARAIWHLVEGMDLGAFEQQEQNRGERAGRPRWSPQVLISVWIYAYSQGIASARAIQRSLGWEPALRWLTANEVINYHTLASFRMSQKELLEALFAQILAVLQDADLVDLRTVLQDGTKVRAQAGRESFRRRKTLERHLEEARQVVAELGRRVHEEEAQEQRVRAAQQRAANEKQARIEAALAELQRREAETAGDKKGAELRVSETEAEARKMKHPDGGWAPSYNVQVTTEAQSRVVVAVEVTTAVNDAEQLAPALERVRQTTGVKPEQVIADGGYVSREVVEETSASGVELIAPWKDEESRSAGACARQGIGEDFRPSAFAVNEEGQALICPQGCRLERIRIRKHHGVPCAVYEARAADCQACRHRAECCPRAGVRRVERVIESAAMQQFRRRMETAEARQLYQRRSEVAEFPHMWWKGLWEWRRFSVRGLARAAKEALWLAIAYNVQQWIRLSWKPLWQAA